MPCGRVSSRGGGAFHLDRTRAEKQGFSKADRHGAKVGRRGEEFISRAEQRASVIYPLGLWFTRDYTGGYFSRAETRAGGEGGHFLELFAGERTFEL